MKYDMKIMEKEKKYFLLPFIFGLLLAAESEKNRRSNDCSVQRRRIFNTMMMTSAKIHSKKNGEKTMKMKKML